MTKPTEQPPEWASDDNYTDGPKAGNPTKSDLPAQDAQALQGHIPGKIFPTAGNAYNAFLNKVSLLSQYTFAATSVPDLDQHILETDSLGRGGMAGLLTGGTSLAFTGILARNNGANTAITVVCDEGVGIALSTFGGAPNLTLQQVNTGAIQPQMVVSTVEENGIDNVDIRNFGVGRNLFLQAELSPAISIQINDSTGGARAPAFHMTPQPTPNSSTLAGSLFVEDSSELTKSLQFYAENIFPTNIERRPGYSVYAVETQVGSIVANDASPVIMASASFLPTLTPPVSGQVVLIEVTGTLQTASTVSGDIAIIHITDITDAADIKIDAIAISGSGVRSTTFAFTVKYTCPDAGAREFALRLAYLPVFDDVTGSDGFIRVTSFK